MSDSDQGTSANALENRVADLNKAVEEFKELLARNKQRKLIFVVAMLTTILIIVFMLVGLKNHVTNVDADKVMELLNNRVHQMAEEHQKNLMSAIEEAYPEVRRKIEKKLSEHAPQLQAKAAQEVDVLIANLHAGVERQVEKEIKALEREIRATIAKEFPDLTDEKAAVMVANFQKAIVEEVQAFAEKYLEQHASVLVDIERTLKDMKPEKGDKIPVKREALVAELRRVALQLFQMKLVHMADSEI